MYDGTLEHYKAQWVAWDFNQFLGIDYDKIQAASLDGPIGSIVAANAYWLSRREDRPSLWCPLLATAPVKFARIALQFIPTQ